MMNKTAGLLATIGLLQEDAHPVVLAQKDACGARPSSVSASVGKFFQRKTQASGNTACFRHAQLNLIPVATYSATEAYH